MRSNSCRYYWVMAESVANVILNLVLGYFFGVAGIIMGTLISLLIINFGYGSQILFKHYFGSHKIWEYFMRHGIYAFVTLAVCIVTVYLCSFINIGGILELTVKGLICVVVPNVLYFLIYRKTSLYAEAVGFVRKLVLKKE